jgi:starch synthase
VPARGSSKRKLRVAFIAAECEPWAKTGGLADVVDALARALGEVAGDVLETPVDVFLPRYRGLEVPPGTPPGRPLRVADPYALGGSTDVEIVDVAADGYRLRLVDHAPAFDRSGYYGEAGVDFEDNAWRFGLLCRAAAAALLEEGRVPDVMHLHDWHAAPATLLRDGAFDEPGLETAAVLLTVHNLAYHGWTPRDLVPQLGIVPGELGISRDADGVDLLATAIERADLVNTVSPGFAAEALTPAFGMGLDGRLRTKGDRFFGILNGLDTDSWNPATDATLAATYSREDRRGKAACRADLLKRIGFDPKDGGTVFGMIGRLDPQKGFDLLAEAAEGLLADGARLVVQGSGDHANVADLRRLAKRQPKRVAMIERFDRDMARRIYAGADGFLMPSRFEPCGTGQMIGLRYGTPPIVHATGGLRDTVIDVTAHPNTGTGFTFEEATPDALREACDRAIALHQAGNRRWEALLDRGMAVDFDWRTGSAPRYVEAYRRAVEVRRTPPQSPSARKSARTVASGRSR